MSNAIAKGIKKSATKVTKAVGQDIGKAVSGAVKQVAHGSEKVAKNTAEAEEAHLKHLQSIHVPKSTLQSARNGMGSTPVYRIRDDRVIERLTPNGPRALTADERKSLPLKLNGKDQVGKRPTGKKNPYNLKELPKGASRPKKHSDQVDFDHDELSRATQLARHEDQSYGNYSKDKDSNKYNFSSNNYAAVRHGQEGDPGGFILVGRSRFPTHSERILGIPFLQAGDPNGITALYTEREPCTSRANCSAWMCDHLPGHVQVSHTVEYGFTDESQKRGNAQMEKHLRDLNPRPSHHAFRTK
ncbi:nucleic acid/nucleotide deaminase domain-containing protein [Kitasatospora sp. NPDC048540]|uniref:nucleic acid/nucleotide deaminase domain-containing protein n=1 Tax=Kitasatospora sp. NPDC048540 TaxID=3155634 RepID=UPI0033FAEF84